MFLYSHFSAAGTVLATRGLLLFVAVPPKLGKLHLEFNSRN